MTGRHGIRSGNGSVHIETAIYGLTQWEYTMANMLSDVGYATAIFGKWHLGHTEGRFPTDQGFDEWYGIPNSTDESLWAGNSMFDPKSHPFARLEHVMEGRKGQAPTEVKVYDLKARALIDRELTDHTIDFMKRQVEAGKPFFAYVPYTMVHIPVVPHPDFSGSTGNGFWADTLAQIDAYAGELLDTVDKLGIRDRASLGAFPLRATPSRSSGLTSKVSAN
jgi:arylsulfatase